MKKTHYKHGCDKGSNRAYYGGGYGLGPVVETIEETTCNDCARIIKKHGLRNRSEFPAIPTFDAVAEGRWKYSGGKEGCHLSFTCPVCGKRNHHGGEYGNPGGGDGHRCSHCSCWENGYFVREVIPANAESSYGRGKGRAS